MKKDKRRTRRTRSPNGLTRKDWASQRKFMFSRNVTYAAVIKFFRIDCDVTQDELARAMRVHQGTIANRESGRVKVTPELVKIHMIECEKMRTS